MGRSMVVVVDWLRVEVGGGLRWWNGSMNQGSVTVERLGLVLLSVLLARVKSSGHVD